MPGFLYSYNRFRDSFELPIVKNADAEALDRLHRMTAPFILRRLKRDVLHDLPEKTETIRTSVMGEEQRALYLGNVLKARERLADLTSGNAESGRMVLLALLTRLRQLCCDPALCYEDYTGGSAKLESCLELLREAADGGHKVLLFPSSPRCSPFWRSGCGGGDHLLHPAGLDLQGKTGRPGGGLQPDATQVFLISLKAGGTGLNLTGADVVIHYDPWWNLSAQEQATDRAHRIGQKNSVQVYKLIAKDTIEEKNPAFAGKQKELADAVIRQGGSCSPCLRNSSPSCWRDRKGVTAMAILQVEHLTKDYGEGKGFSTCPSLSKRGGVRVPRPQRGGEDHHHPAYPRLY